MMNSQSCTLVVVKEHIDVRWLSVEMNAGNDAMTTLADSEEVDNEDDVDDDDGDFDDDDEDDYDDEDDD